MMVLHFGLPILTLKRAFCTPVEVMELSKRGPLKDSASNLHRYCSILQRLETTLGLSCNSTAEFYSVSPTW